MMEHPWLTPYPRLRLAFVIWLGALACGCGSTKSRLATEQLVMSDAVDRSVAEIDFRALSGRKVFLDTKYATSGKTTSIVNNDYIISSVRQQMMAADCRLVDTADTADLIAELRIGTLGTDANDVVYGLPASNAVSGAAALVPNAPIIPPIPEISLARREAQLGAAKIALFAYDRETRRPVWQSGISRARSTAQDFWVFGAGPFQRGSNVEGTQFAGTKLRMPHLRDDGTFDESPPIAYEQTHLFQAPTAPAEVNVAQFVAPVRTEKTPAAPKPAPPAKAETKQDEAAAPAPAPPPDASAAKSQPESPPAAAAASPPSSNSATAPAPASEATPAAEPPPAAGPANAGQTIHVTDQKK